MLARLRAISASKPAKIAGNRRGKAMLKRWRERMRAPGGGDSFYMKDNCRDRPYPKLYTEAISQNVQGLCWLQKKWYYQEHHHKHAWQRVEHKNASHPGLSMTLSLSEYLLEKAENESVHARREGAVCCRGRVEGDKDSVSGKWTWIASHQLPICCEAVVTGRGLRGGLRQSRPAADGEENNFWCQ